MSKSNGPRLLPQKGPETLEEKLRKENFKVMTDCATEIDQTLKKYGCKMYTQRTTVLRDDGVEIVMEQFKVKKLPPTAKA